MRRLHIIFIIILAVAVILPLFMTAGCSKKPDGIKTDADISESDKSKDETNENDNVVYKDGFAFVYNGVTVYMGDNIENIATELGEYSSLNEADSCTAVGVEKAYEYNGFLVSGYAKSKEGEFGIYSIEFIDDSVSTAEGLYIGQTVGDMLAIYGDGYTDDSNPEFGLYKYEKNGTNLLIDVEDDIIINITYMRIKI